MIDNVRCITVLMILLAAVAVCQPPPCKPPCEYGGVCQLSRRGTPRCSCPPPYQRPTCSTAGNYCELLQPDRGVSSLPVCLNGGKCTQSVVGMYFNCSCPSGYEGLRCEKPCGKSVPISNMRSGGDADADKGSGGGGGGGVPPLSRTAIILMATGAAAVAVGLIAVTAYIVRKQLTKDKGKIEPQFEKFSDENCKVEFTPLPEELSSVCGSKAELFPDNGEKESEKRCQNI